MASTLTRWDPFQQIAQVQRELNRTFPREWPIGSRQEMTLWVPATDIEQTEDAIVFKLDMPSTTKEDISIELHGRTLTISGERREERQDKHEGYLSRERTYGRFSRSFMMPEDVSEDDITATFHDGELKVTVPRPKIETPRKIEIASS
jgi:HSP20 family protein